MAKLSTAKIVGMLSSAKKTGRQVLNAAGEWVAEIVEDFVSGFAGHGWKIWEYVKGKWKLEIDAIVVRGTMTIFELLIQKIRAVKGALGITQACGKIKTAELDADGMNWLITIEDEMSFVAHDFIRCQDWQGGNLKGYWVEISEVRQVDGVDTIVVPVSEFMGGIGYTDGMEAVKPELTGMTTPAIGDEIVQFGNSINENRQSAIYLHADEGGQPAIDILFGIKSKSFAGCVKQRMGGDIPGTDGLKGFYCENGMIKGTDETGHTVYCIYPDGSAEFGDGSAKFNTDRSGKLAGGAISWKWDAAKGKYICTMGDVILSWDNLGDDVKENLKVIGIQDADVEYAQSDSSSVEPTDGWQTTSPAWANGKYIWSRTKITFTDGTINYTRAACISGGKGIASIVEQYYLSSSSSSLSDGSWSVDKPAWKKGWFFWTRSVITFTDGTSTTTEAICATGEKGEAGVGIQDADVEYAQCDSSTVAPATGWQTDAPAWQNGKYIWSRTKITYTDGTISYTKAACISGGKGISSIVEQYYLSSSSSILSSGEWSAVRPAWKNGWYIWTRSVITFTDGTSTATDAICVTGEKGEQGDKGDKGDKGDDGLPGSDANVPDWVKEWDSGKVQIGDKYMISPALFTGKNTGTADAPVLTGILQGDKCITIDGVERSGIYALVENQVVFELDPENRKYKFKGTVEADEGHIGDFEIGHRRIGIDISEEGASNGMFLYDDMIGFNGTNKQAIIGTYSVTGVQQLGNFSDTAESSLPKYGVTITLQNGIGESTALTLGGGYVSGFAVKPEVVSTSKTIDRSVGVVICVNTEPITITLPVCYEHDNGKILWIKNMNGKNVNIKPSSDMQPINYDQGRWATPASPDNLASAGDASAYIFIWRLRRNGSETDTGAWVQFKNPRDW